MRKYLPKLCALMSLATIAACSETGFQSTTPHPSRGQIAEKGGEGNVLREPPKFEETKSDPAADDPSKCWVAVSGGAGWYAPSQILNSSFPKTLSGRPIRHGEAFDTTGGVFLRARDTPYRHGEGGGEIDRAITGSLDFVAVAPGMRVKILDKNGAVLLEHDGPYLAVSAASSWPIPKTEYFERPKWLLDFVSQKYAATPVVPTLYTVDSILVSKIPGTSCE